ncbi:META domain-containing protein [Corynebacterium sp. 32222D000AT]|uniref:META domain-containing protein n=1 Tax=unclassified Corynebacterium TaxID=2624378 RepID=UPI002A962B27|nr:META domain-containing protein [Mycobacteriaceae bacterium]MDY5829597.1 META domain-containing protein [Corynebacterium sp.]
MVSKKIKTLTASTAVAAGLALSAPAALAAPTDSPEPDQETSGVDQLSSVVTPELLEQLLGLSSNSEAASTAAGSETTESTESAAAATSGDAATATPSEGGEEAKSELVTTLPEGATKLQPKGGNETISGKLVSTVKPDAVSITLQDDGTLSFEDGCNGGNAEYSFDSEGALEVGTITSTQMACEPAAMADAAAITKILESKPAIYQLDNSTLALAAGDDAIEFKPAQTEEGGNAAPATQPVGPDASTQPEASAPATAPEAEGAASDQTPVPGAEVNQDASQAGNTGAETANVDDEGVVQPDTTADQTGPAGATA